MATFINISERTMGRQSDWTYSADRRWHSHIHIYIYEVCAFGRTECDISTYWIQKFNDTESTKYVLYCTQFHTLRLNLKS